MKPVSPAASYVAILPILIDAARDCGYALALHGSMARDLDLVAVPWTWRAIGARALVARLAEVAGARRITPFSRKPHGRRAWSLILGHGRYLDVSVTPRRGPR